MRPAEVWGWERKPSSSRSAMALRMEAGLRPSLRWRDTVREATGSPDSMYSSTIECRISRSRAVMDDALGIKTQKRTQLALWLDYKRLCWAGSRWGVWARLGMIV